MNDPYPDQAPPPQTDRATRSARKPPGPLEYGLAEPRASAQWWFVVAVLAAGALSFGAVWAVFDYRAGRAPSPPAAMLPLGPGPAPPWAAARVPSVPAYDETPGRADAAACARHLQRIAAALQAWANRHDWHLPDRLEDLAAAGLLDPADLLCPAAEPSGASVLANSSDLPAPLPSAAASTTRPAGPRSDYVYLGRGLTTPAGFDTVVAYEPPRHFGGIAMNVLFGDGGVRVLTGDDARRLAAAAESGHRPVEWPALAALAATRPAQAVVGPVPQAGD